MSLDQRNYEEKRDFIRVPVVRVEPGNDELCYAVGSAIRAIRNE